MYLKLHPYLFGLVFIFHSAISTFSQIQPTEKDSIVIQQPDSLLDNGADSLKITGDTLVVDSVGVDSAKVITGESTLDAKVEYKARDSIEVNIPKNIIYLYGAATVTYKTIKLEADYIEFDMQNKEVFARGVADSTGELSGKPVFEDGDQTFESKRMRYNFNTQKGIIQHVKSPQEGGFLHCDTCKRHSGGDIHIKRGKYTTCDLDHPHYYIAMRKAKVIPQDKIVSGLAYLVVEDIPVPLGLPFGFFPNTPNAASGLLIPSYGEENSRGFFLKEGGYYFAINDFMDLRVTGDIYSKGTWGLKANTNYKKRYKYSGNFSGRYYKNKFGEEGLTDQPTTVDYAIRWSHRQDPKANPNFTFNANVDYSTTTYDERHSTSQSDYLSNTKSSSIGFSQRWPSFLWGITSSNLNGSLNHTQNSLNKKVSMTLPNLTYNINRFYPLRGIGDGTGDKKWYENISIQYNANLKNKVQAVDSLFWTQETLDNMNYGFQHNIPVSLLLRHKKISFANLTPSINYKGYLYYSYLDKYWNTDTTVLTEEEIRGFSYAQNITPNASLTVNPKIYGFYSFTNEDFVIETFRHVMTPSATLSYSPDMSKYFSDKYYRQVYDTTRQSYEEYSIYEGYIFGAPSGRKTSARLSLSLKNNLEMKYKNWNDTAMTVEKLTIIENFDFRTNYNVIENKWTPLVLTAGTRMLNNKINIKFGATWLQYAQDENFETTKKLVWKDWQLGKMTQANMSVGISLSSAAGKKKSVNEEGEIVEEPHYDPWYDEFFMEYMGYDYSLYGSPYVDFDVPWTLRVNYSYKYTKPKNKISIKQSLRISGDVKLTNNWKVGANTGYDITMKKVTPTNLNIYRDLHCWEMRLTMVPFGKRKSYTFTINVKASILQDIKWDKRESWYDNI